MRNEICLGHNPERFVFTDDGFRTWTYRFSGWALVPYDSFALLPPWKRTGSEEGANPVAEEKREAAESQKRGHS